MYFLRVIFLVIALFQLGHSSSKDVLIDEKNHVTKEVCELLKLTGVKANSDSLKDVVEATQKSMEEEKGWLGKNPIKIFLKNPSIKDAQTAQKILALYLDKLGFSKECTPKKEDLDSVKGIIIHGTTLPDFVNRVGFVKKLRDEGVLKKNTPIYVLCGERPLNKLEGETRDALEKVGLEKDAPMLGDETQMVDLVMKNSGLDSFKVIKASKEPSSYRATTMDTVKKWVADFQSPLEKGIYLSTSDQPFVLFQQCVVERGVKSLNNIKIVGIGPKLDLEETKKLYNINDIVAASIALDNLARVLYELHLTTTN